MEALSPTFAAAKVPPSDRAQSGPGTAVSFGPARSHGTGFASSSRRGPSPHAPGVGVPLRFMLTGVVALLAGVGFLIARPEVLAAYHYNQYVIAVTHLWVLGFVGSILMGALYQLVPVALEIRLHSERLARWHYAAHVVGVAGMVGMFWVWNMKLVGVFGSLVALGVAWFVYNLGRTLARIPRWNLIASGIASSLGWLSCTVLAGLYLAASKWWAFSPFDPIAALHAHAHLGVVGAFLILIMSVSYKMLPMFLLSDVQSRVRAWWSLALLNVSLAGAFLGILGQRSWKLLFAFLGVAGLILYGWELRAIVRARQRRPLDWGVIYFLTALGMLVPTSALALVLSWPGLPLTALTGQLETAYGFLGIFAVAGFAILGMLYKIVPFLVWYHAYGPHVGRSRVPILADMYSSRVQAAGYVLLLLGIAGLSAAAALGHAEGVRGSAVILGGALALFAVNLGMILRHLLRPQLGALAPRPVASSNPQRLDL